MKKLTLATALIILAACDQSTDPQPDPTIWDDVPAGKSLASLAIQGTAPAAVAKALADSIVLPVNDVNGVNIGTLVLHDARVALKDIELMTEEEQDGADELEIEFAGPFVVDLITNMVAPSLDTVIIDTGNYTQIELKIDKIEGDEEDDDGTQLVDPADPLFGNSIYLSGTYSGMTAGGQVTGMPFVMSFDFGEEFELSTIDSATGVADTSLGFDVQEQTLAAIIIAFRLAKWFNFTDPETNSDGVDFNSLMTVEDPPGTFTILLDEDADGDNDAIRDVIKENIEESADYGEDKDGNGILESDEDDDPDEDDDDDD